MLKNRVINIREDIGLYLISSVLEFITSPHQAKSVKNS